MQNCTVPFFVLAVFLRSSRDPKFSICFPLQIIQRFSGNFDTIQQSTFLNIKSTPFLPTLQNVAQNRIFLENFGGFLDRRNVSAQRQTRVFLELCSFVFVMECQWNTLSIFHQINFLLCALFCLTFLTLFHYIS